MPILDILVLTHRIYYNFRILLLYLDLSNLVAGFIHWKISLTYQALLRLMVCMQVVEQLLKMISEN